MLIIFLGLVSLFVIPLLFLFAVLLINAETYYIVNTLPNINYDFYYDDTYL